MDHCVSTMALASLNVNATIGQVSVNNYRLAITTTIVAGEVNQTLSGGSLVGAAYTFSKTINFTEMRI